MLSRSSLAGSWEVVNFSSARDDPQHHPNCRPIQPYEPAFALIQDPGSVVFCNRGPPGTTHLSRAVIKRCDTTELDVDVRRRSQDDFSIPRLRLTMAGEMQTKDMEQRRHHAVGKNPQPFCRQKNIRQSCRPSQRSLPVPRIPSPKKDAFLLFSHTYCQGSVL